MSLRRGERAGVLSQWCRSSGTSRLAVLKALVDWSIQHEGQLAKEVVQVRAEELQAVQNGDLQLLPLQTVCDAFEVETAEDRKLLVPCCLTLNVLKVGCLTATYPLAPLLTRPRADVPPSGGSGEWRRGRG